MKEVDHYPEIAKEIVSQFEANLSSSESFVVKPLIGEISSSLRTLIANGYNAGENVADFSNGVHRLHLDISLLIENPINGKFEVVIFEIKKVKNLGLSELSQLIGYCLVSKCKFGILMNVDAAVSREFSIILDGDKDLTSIKRIVDEKEIEHELGVMVWNSETQRIEYTNSGAIKSMPALVRRIEDLIS